MENEELTKDCASPLAQLLTKRDLSARYDIVKTGIEEGNEAGGKQVHTKDWASPLVQLLAKENLSARDAIGKIGIEMVGEAGEVLAMKEEQLAEGMQQRDQLRTESEAGG